jgi:H+/Cl- antiporter ClcA
MGIPLMGTAYILEMGRRNKVPLTTERMLAALVGGIVGWALDTVLGLSLIRLVVPTEPPDSFPHAVSCACMIGALSGGITSFAGAAIYAAKKWRASPVVRLALGGVTSGATALLLVHIGGAQTAVGPGGGAIVWAEQNALLHPSTLMAVSLLRAVATASAAAAGGCGGIFVPFLAVGDLAGRVFAPEFGVNADLGGATGAAAGIAGGYHLPWTAVAMVLAYGGPRLATVTCLTTVAMAYVAGVGVDWLLERLKQGSLLGPHAHAR